MLTQESMASRGTLVERRLDVVKRLTEILQRYQCEGRSRPKSS